MKRFAALFLSILFVATLAPAHATVAKRKKSRGFFASAPAVKWPERITTIVLDPGHGGWDRGGIPGQSIGEKEMTLDVAKRIGPLLQRAGFQVVMTRRDDTFISLPQRVSVTNSQQDAVFVSIHFNASFNGGARGFETHYCSPVSAKLADSIQSNLICSCTTENRGVKHANFYVLRNARVPAVLVECGFLTNSDEGKLTLSAAHRARMAKCIAQGIIAQCKS
jgi:N-acetylmuramoyl-L-alanine amidase